MRNIEQYPATKEEIIRALQRVQIENADLNTNMSLAPMILRDILKAAEENPLWMMLTFGGNKNYEQNIANSPID